jgi:hypothetical protein
MQRNLIYCPASLIFLGRMAHETLQICLMFWPWGSQLLDPASRHSALVPSISPPLLVLEQIGAPTHFGDIKPLAAVTRLCPLEPTYRAMHYAKLE